MRNLFHKNGILVRLIIQPLHITNTINIYSLLNIKKTLKNLVLGPGTQRTFRLSSHTPRIIFNVLSGLPLYLENHGKILNLTLQAKKNLEFEKFRKKNLEKPGILTSSKILI